MKVYISGGITGTKNCKKKFARAEKMLKERGHIVLNPTVLPEGLTYEHYIGIDLEMLKGCDAIYMLKGWQESRGATLEREYAIAMGIPRMYEEDKR